MLIVRDLFLGRRHFKEFLASPEGIATNILADRLAKLVDAGYVEKYPSDEIPGKDAYRLTAAGATLKGLLQSIANWGLQHIEGTKQNLKPKRGGASD